MLSAINNKLLKVKILFPLIIVASIVIFLSHTAFTKTAIFADGKFYYAITRSIVKDHDIKFSNEYIKLGIKIDYTNNDYVWNQYPPGVSFLWIPLFIIADGVSQIPSLFGINIALFNTEGFSLIYQSAAALTNITLGIFGLYFIYLVLKEFYSENVVLLTIITLYTTTNLLFYITVEPINSHAASFFVASLFIYYFFKHKKDKYYYFTLGAIGGVAGLIRTQDILILSLPIIQIIFEERKLLSSLVIYYLQLTAGFFILFSPQIYFWKKIFNTYWHSPYLNSSFPYLASPKISHVLFNTQNGLFTLTPIIAVALLGIVVIIIQQLKEVKNNIIKSLFFLPNQLKFSLFALFYFVLQLYLISSWSSYKQGGSFSIRMIIPTYPLLSFGLAEIIKKAYSLLEYVTVLILILFLTSLNIFQIVHYLWIF